MSVKHLKGDDAGKISAATSDAEIKQRMVTTQTVTLIMCCTSLQEMTQDRMTQIKVNKLSVSRKYQR